MKHTVLKKIGGLLNDNNIEWALGASYALYFYGLVETPRDIDILVHEDYINEAIACLSTLGELQEEPPKGDYLTEYFYYFCIDNMEIDVICNFKLKHKEGVYSYLFDQDSIAHVKYVDGVKIPIIAIEEWYVLYLIMDNKKERGDLIEGYFDENMSVNAKLLRRALNQTLPDRIYNRASKWI